MYATGFAVIRACEKTTLKSSVEINLTTSLKFNNSKSAPGQLKHEGLAGFSYQKCTLWTFLCLIIPERHPPRESILACPSLRRSNSVSTLIVVLKDK